MPRQDETEFLTRVLLGNKAAVEFVRLLARVSQVWDDLVDGDPVHRDDIHKTMWSLLVELPANPFYQQYQGFLVPLLAQYAQDYMDSVELETTKSGRVIAFTLRDQIGAIVTQCAYLIGGFDYARSIAIEVREHVHEDEVDEYVDQLLSEEKPT